MNGPPGSTIAQCPQDRRSTRRRLSRYSPRGQCSGDLESSSPSTKPGQLHYPDFTQELELVRCWGQWRAPLLPRELRERVAGSSMPDTPTTKYAKSGDVHIAYQVVGDGPNDLVFVPGWVSHVEYAWEDPFFAHFLRRLASFSRLILLDRRGTGL